MYLRKGSEVFKMFVLWELMVLHNCDNEVVPQEKE